MPSRTITFFDLPRELRDEIYKYHYQPTPHTKGVVWGYTEVPSTALRSTCAQIRAEATTYYHKGLQAALLRDKVCITLAGKSEDGTVRHAGWTRVNPTRFDIWVRNGPDTTVEAAWLLHVTPVWRGPDWIKPTDREQTQPQLQQLRIVAGEVGALFSLLEKWANLFSDEERSSQVSRRLFCVRTRVAETAARMLLADTTIEDFGQAGKTHLLGVPDVQDDGLGTYLVQPQPSTFTRPDSAPKTRQMK